MVSIVLSILQSSATIAFSICFLNGAFNCALVKQAAAAKQANKAQKKQSCKK